MMIIEVYRWLVWRWAKFVNPVRELPPKGQWWFHNWTGPTNAPVWVLFTVDEQRSKYTRYHVTLILSRGGRYWVVDPSHQLMIAPITDAGRFIRAVNPEYVAQGETPVREENTFGMLYEPYSCVTLTRSMLGMFDPRIQTPEQLLVELWRRRHGRSR